MQYKLKNGYIEDSTATAIINATDCCIWFGDGVDGALRQRGGWDYINACQKITEKYSPIPTGDSIFMINPSKNLKCRYIIHTVSPCWKDIEPYWMLYKTVKKLLKKCSRMKLKTVSIPILGSGAFQLDIDKCYRAIKEAIKDTKGKTIVEIVHPNYQPKRRKK